MDSNNLDEKAKMILNELANEGISFGDIELILLYAKEFMKELIPSKS